MHVLHGFFSISKRSITADTSAPRERPLPITRYPHDRMPNYIAYSNSARVIQTDQSDSAKVIQRLVYSDSAKVQLVYPDSTKIQLAYSDSTKVKLAYSDSAKVIKQLSHSDSARPVGLDQSDPETILVGLGQR